MSEHTQIDWSQVVPGKTWLESPTGGLCRVVAVEGEAVWVYSNRAHLTWSKSSIDACKWRIREAWGKVTRDCYLQWSSGCSSSAIVRYKGHIITNWTDEFKLDGMEVYKRRSL